VGHDLGLLPGRKPWTTLLEELAKECTATDGRRKRLKHVLEWAEKNRIKQRRDNVIHAHWWNFDGCGVVRSRFRRDQKAAIMPGSFEDLEEDAQLLFEFARRLDELLGEDWPRAVLAGGK
jgi:hypothetical protein